MRNGLDNVEPIMLYLRPRQRGGLWRLAAAWDRTMSGVVRVLIERELRRISLPLDGKCPTCGCALTPNAGAVTCRQSDSGTAIKVH